MMATTFSFRFATYFSGDHAG